MQLKKVTNDFFVSAQPQKNDIQVAIDSGIRSFICNRPDNEELGQPSSDELAALIADNDLDFQLIPVSGGNFAPEAIDEFKIALAKADKPCLAFCRSGTRSITLWALSQQHDLPLDEVITTAQQAGYNLEHLRERLT